MKRFFLALLLVVAVILAGCGGASGGGGGKVEAPKEVPKSATKEVAKEQPKGQAGEKYPDRPINFIVPFEAGSGGDILTRPLAEKAAAKLGQPIVVTNKPGAAGTIGTKDIFEAKPDGYTLGLQASTLVTSKQQGMASYNHRDLSVLGVFNVSVPVVISSVKRPWKTIQEVIDYAKSHPGEINLATSSKGALWWIGAVVFQEATGLKVNIIPQAGASGYAVTQVAGGHADIGVLGIPEAKSQIEAGNVRLLAVISSQRAAGKYSNAPTLKEVGYNANVSTGHCIIGPKGLPKPVFDRLVQVFGEVVQSPEYKQFLIDQNGTPVWLPAEQAVKYYDEQVDIFKPVLERAGLLKEK